MDKIMECLQNNVNINCRNRDNENGYTLASRHPNIDLLTLLENKGIDIQNCTNKGYNAYLIASTVGNHYILQHLEEIGVQINKLDKEGNNAYILASLYGHRNVLRYFDKFGKILSYHKNFDNKNAYTPSG